MADERTGEMGIFVRAVELGGFSAAARALELTPSAVSKAISRLEDRLGVRLLNRTTRSLTPTPEGATFLERSRRILADIDEAEQEITRFRSAPRGRLRLHISVAFGLHLLPPVLPDFVRRYPEVELDITVNDREPDFAEEGIDLAVRSGDVADQSLIARRICLMERVICAAPSYLKAHGVPRTPDDLLDHNCLLVSSHPDLAYWPFDTPQGLRSVKVGGNLMANNAETVVQLAILGLGITRLGDILVGEPLHRKQLVPLLVGAHHVEPVPIHAMYLPGRHRSPKVAAMVEFLLEHFSHAPWRLPSRRSAPRSRASVA
ncbi:MAG: LysR family transcriptional regulator [Burkholderiaceae bacterium]|jgi:DNA-binding transcriptional LysR family regulator|nr:LysR family transcriptional regulator [Burkholderiaceae bacterium]MDH5208513.1 LysR family transcriptional regulator [Burkholderiaceae bacterium]